MSGKQGMRSALPTELPARLDRLFPWSKLDRRCVAVREFAADLAELWQDLGGVDSLSVQQRWLCERVVFMRRRMLAYETALLKGTDRNMDAGTYSNHANVMQGYLKALGLERRARPAKSIQDYLAGSAP